MTKVDNNAPNDNNSEQRGVDAAPVNPLLLVGGESSGSGSEMSDPETHSTNVVPSIGTDTQETESTIANGPPAGGYQLLASSVDDVLVVADDDSDSESSSDDDEAATPRQECGRVQITVPFQDMDDAAAVVTEAEESSPKAMMVEDKRDTCHHLSEQDFPIAHTPRTDCLDLDGAKVAMIQSCMQGFQLPTQNVPSWAAEVPEEKWKKHLLERIGSKNHNKH